MVVHAETIGFPKIVPAFSFENSPLIAIKPSNIRKRLPSECWSRGSLGVGPVEQADPWHAEKEAQTGKPAH